MRVVQGEDGEEYVNLMSISLSQVIMAPDINWTEKKQRCCFLVAVFAAIFKYPPEGRRLLVGPVRGKSFIP